MNKKEIRKNFKDSVFKRDNWTCKVCGEGPYENIDFFDAHHITDRSEMPNGGYVKENGITVCKNQKISTYGFQESCHILSLLSRNIYKLILSNIVASYLIFIYHIILFFLSFIHVNKIAQFLEV